MVVSVKQQILVSLQLGHVVLIYFRQNAATLQFQLRQRIFAVG